MAQIKKKETFADIMRKPSSIGLEKVTSQEQAKSTTYWNSRKKLFFTNLGLNIAVTEVWKTFKQFGQISDIILPQKKDKYGNRFGFILAKSNRDAVNILKEASRINFHGKPIKMDWARKLTNNRLEKRHQKGSSSERVDKHVNNSGDMTS